MTPVKDNTSSDLTQAQKTDYANGFFRDPETIATRLTRLQHEVPELNQPHSDYHWETFTGLAWRPAWSIRSRSGCLAPILDWWRTHRAK